MKMCKITYYKEEKIGFFNMDSIPKEANAENTKIKSIISIQYIKSEHQAKLAVKDFSSRPGYSARYEVINIED